MSHLIFFMESYTAGGSDRVARVLIEHLPAAHIILMVNRNIDDRVLFSGPLPKNIQLYRYSLITPMDIGIFANRHRNIPTMFLLLKLVDYLVRYPLLIVSIVYFYFIFRKFNATHFIAHNGGYPGGLYCGTAVMAAALLRSGIRRFYAFHSLPRAYSRLQGFVERLWDRILDRSCQMICVSRKSGDVLGIARLFKQKPICIHNGLETAVIKTYPMKEGLKLLHVGYFDFIKNQKMLVNALSELVRQGSHSITVTFVGDVSVPEAREEVDRLVKSMGLENRIEFKGFCRDMRGHYESHDLLILTSKIESFPLVVLEAMRVGMPVIATNVGGLSEQVQEGVNGFLVEVDDVASMSDKILFYYRNRDQIKVMGEAGYRIFQEKFTVEQMIQQYDSALGLSVDPFSRSMQECRTSVPVRV